MTEESPPPLTLILGGAGMFLGGLLVGRYMRGRITSGPNIEFSKDVQYIGSRAWIKQKPVLPEFTYPWRITTPPAVVARSGISDDSDVLHLVPKDTAKGVRYNFLTSAVAPVGRV
jgi:hypothetical protein